MHALGPDAAIGERLQIGRVPAVDGIIAQAIKADHQDDLVVFHLGGRQGRQVGTGGKGQCQDDRNETAHARFPPSIQFTPLY